MIHLEDAVGQIKLIVRIDVLVTKSMILLAVVVSRQMRLIVRRDVMDTRSTTPLEVAVSRRIRPIAN